MKRTPAGLLRDYRASLFRSRDWRAARKRAVATRRACWL